MRRRLMRHAVLFAVLVQGGCEQKVAIHKGDELFAIADDAILAVSLRERGRRAEAHRFTPEQQLHFSFERTGGSFERCPEVPRLSAALASLRSLRVRDVMDEAQARQLSPDTDPAWIELEVRDIIVPPEPFRLRLLRDRKNRGQVFARLPGDTRTVVLDSSLLALLELGCAEPR